MRGAACGGLAQAHACTWLVFKAQPSAEQKAVLDGEARAGRGWGAIHAGARMHGLDGWTARHHRRTRPCLLARPQSTTPPRFTMSRTGWAASRCPCPAARRRARCMPPAHSVRALDRAVLLRSICLHAAICVHARAPARAPYSLSSKGHSYHRCHTCCGHHAWILPIAFVSRACSWRHRASRAYPAGCMCAS